LLADFGESEEDQNGAMVSGGKSVPVEGTSTSRRLGSQNE